MSGYDRALSIFSPDGHIFQVEYALEAVRRGTCAVGVKGPRCVVLGCERRSTLKLQDPRTTPSKVALVDTHVALSFAGLSADARVLIERARTEAQSHRLTLEDPVSVEYMARYIAGIQQKYTQSGGVRPFGVSTLVAGFDSGDDTPRLYHTEPSGIYSAWTAQTIGRNAKTVREFLEKNYAGESTTAGEKSGESAEASAGASAEASTPGPSSVEECVRLTVRSLLEVVQTGAKNIEITVIEPDNKITALSNEQIAAHVEEIEREKQA
ncbi:proteasome core particle subunit alpha 4 KNAG_0L01020 [Huiozyma naganishii CBS 8797]|uniref:Proteasome alpha-type subunits domain-containing protein n=1 Tax=Huiozyma naganishii (strain ATCC MYA-139 / BCRC 22969 / CBS 8797 / KCTC 17520 / NBRC 10181 / NCYC 3082 / Yp74L-3) TaxID=1071383 RepID=J7RS51_HUIN7|nr:hypothetical protein KNAG_0L01020 [Kazachstania naganishii CBS 8797]CCK72723.1 hypothetical protein KNAG_0L01020 [Kazachstania naganishii CBS 8797]